MLIYEALIKKTKKILLNKTILNSQRGADRAAIGDYQLSMIIEDQFIQYRIQIVQDSLLIK